MLGSAPAGNPVTSVALLPQTMLDPYDGCTITQTPPSPAAMSVGLGPTLIVATTLPRFGSIRDTVPASRFAVQTLLPSVATATGLCPTLTLPTTRFVFGSILTKKLSRLSTTQTPCPSAAMSAGMKASGMLATAFSFTGSTRVTDVAGVPDPQPHPT